MTFNDIVYYVRQKTGKDPDSGLPDSMILTFLNQTLEEWATYFPDTFRAQATGNVTGSSINQPTGIKELIQVAIGGDIYRIILEKDLRFYDNTYDKVAYLRSTYIYFRPATTTSTAYVVDYIGSPTAITTLAGSPQIPTEWHGKLATVVAADLAPTADLIIVREQIMREVRRMPRKALGHRLIRSWQDVADITVSD